jgi:hypothetical protein
MMSGKHVRTRAGIAGMRGLPGSRYLYQELEKIVTYRSEIPRLHLDQQEP